MATFYLQHGISHSPLHKDDSCGWHEVRTFLDDKLQKGNELIQTIEADNWLEARMEVDVPGF